MSPTKRLYAALALVLFIFGQFCVAAPFPTNIALPRSGLSVHVRHPGRVLNVPVARLGVPYVFQLDPHMFTLVDSDSGALLKESPIVALDPDSSIPPWLNFNPDTLTLSGTPDAVPSSPFRIRLVATAPDGGDKNDTAFELFVSNSASPRLISPFENQHKNGLISLVNATGLVTKPGVWIRPEANFTVQPQAFCDSASTNSSLFYTVYLSTEYNLNPLPEWLHFDNTTLTLTGIAPIESTSLNVLFRCSNIFGAGGPQQTLLIDVAEHEIEIHGTPVDLNFISGQPFKYNFRWTFENLLVDTNTTHYWERFYSNGSQFPINVDASAHELGLTISLANYPWMRFDPGLHGRNNATIFGTAPVTNQLVPLELSPIPLNITARGQQLNTWIRVVSQPASPWHPGLQEGVDVRPGDILTHDFELDLIESLRGDRQWDISLQIKDPLNDTDWVRYNQVTHVLSGAVPLGSAPRRITFEAIGNAWGFNTTRTFYVDIFDSPPVYHPGWNSASVTVAVVLSITVIFLVMGLFLFYGLWKGFVVSPAEIYRRRQRSSQTLVDSSLESASNPDKSADSSDIQPHVEHKVEAVASESGVSCMEYEAPAPVVELVERNVRGTTILSVPPPLPSPTSATTPSTLTTTLSVSASSSSIPTSTGPSSPETKPSASHQSSLRRTLKFFKKRAVFRKNKSKKHAPKLVISSTAAAAPHSYVKQKEDKPFTPMWKGHVYQTPELLKTEEDAWKIRRLERKARLKREYFAKKEAEAQGRSTDVPFEAEGHTPRPGAPRRFGIFEQLAKWEDLDRRGPVNMRGDAPRSRLVEVGENRFFNDTMVDRSEVGSSEFSSLASWESLSESSLPDMVLCYGQLGRRKATSGDVPSTPKARIDSWRERSAGPVYREQGSLPEDDDDTFTDENVLDRLAHALGSNRTLDEFDDELGSINSELEAESQTIGSASATPLAKWKGKGVARGEHGSPATSQHSPTFKKLARHRVMTSIDSIIGGSQLSKGPMSGSLVHVSQSTQSIAASASGSLVTSDSMTSLIFHISENGVYLYVIPANTNFSFKAPISKASNGVDEKPTFGRVKASPYMVESEHPDGPSMPAWLKFYAPGLNFWGFAPNTDERLEHAMKIVHRDTGDIVGRFLIVVVRLDKVAGTRAALEGPSTVVGAPGTATRLPPAPKLSAAISLACSPQITGLPSSHSIAASINGSNLSHSESMTNIVFHLARNGIDFFAISAASYFCFQLPGLSIDTTKSTFGRAMASAYAIQMDEMSEVTSIPPWLHIILQTMEFYGEAPDVTGRLRIGMRIISRETGEIVMRVLIVVARLDDIGSLQTELSYGRIKEADGLSVVEEVSSVESDQDLVENIDGVVKPTPAEPKTPECSRTNISTSSSRARSFRGTARSQPGSKLSSPISRRSPGTGGRGGRMRTPKSARLGGGEDYDSLIFEGRSQYSGSLFGPELSTLAGGAISDGALEAMSRAASRSGSISLLPDQRTVAITPTTMDNIEYYVIPGHVDFCFIVQMPKGCAYKVQLESSKGQHTQVTPEWFGVEHDEDTGLLEFSGTTHGLKEYEEHAMLVLTKDTEEVAKHLRMVVVPDSKA